MRKKIIDLAKKNYNKSEETKMNENNIEKIKSIKDIKEIMTNLFPIFFKTKKYIGIFSICFYRIQKNEINKPYKKFLKINDDYYKMNTLFKKGIGGLKLNNYRYYFNIYLVKILKNKIITYPPQNLIKVVFKSNDYNIYMPLVYNLIYFKKYKGLTSRIYNINKDEMVCYFRQAKLNSIALTVRKHNITDRFANRCKILIAKFFDLITPNKDIILLYEKEINKYEESASIVYEKLIDLGYKNVYYIINKNSNHVSFIKDKYKKNIIWGHTLKHYYCFFKCKKFIGTESLPHCVELRIANRYVTRKFIKKDYKQVFLQHGVMYMVALDAKNRGGFRKNGNELPNDAKIVVSSKKEADHFIQLGGFEEDDLYITGLPFYDKTIKNKDADKIVVMLTWRSWDYNLLLSNYKEASYYKMYKKIIKNIPEKYKDKVYLLPHPLVLENFKKTDLVEMIPEILSYDKILEETALLITDYSSISYSAFYRGSNVIFCWDELEECMKNYESHLMLNEANAFGDITYDCKNIGKLIAKNYLVPQTKKNLDRYKKIVEFNDGNNTKRLIECLKKDHII